jgi:hypothetical protein
LPPRVGPAPLTHPFDIVRTLEISGILFNPTPLTCRFAGFSTFRFIAILLAFDATIVRREWFFATPAFTFSDKFHDPAPLG